MFDSMDLKSTGVITFDEWLRFCREHIAAKVSTMDAHPILDSGSVEQYKLYLRAALASPTSPEYVELYWFMLELFTEADIDKDGIVKLAEFASMMDQLVAVPKKHGLTCCPPQVQLTKIKIQFFLVPLSMFQSNYEALLKQYDPVGDGDLTVDEWIKLCTEEVFKKCIA